MRILLSFLKLFPDAIESGLCLEYIIPGCREGTSQCIDLLLKDFPIPIQGVMKGDDPYTSALKDLRKGHGVTAIPPKHRDNGLHILVEDGGINSLDPGTDIMGKPRAFRLSHKLLRLISGDEIDITYFEFEE